MEYWYAGFRRYKICYIMAEHIGSNHHEIILSEKEFLSNIESVIYDIESYDTTSVRASIGTAYFKK